MLLHSWQTFSWLMQNPLLNCLGGWIKSSLRAKSAVFGCPALKMFAPLLPGSVVSALGGMCILKCTNHAKCKPSGHSISQYGDDGHSGTTKVATAFEFAACLTTLGIR